MVTIELSDGSDAGSQSQPQPQSRSIRTRGSRGRQSSRSLDLNLYLGASPPRRRGQYRAGGFDRSGKNSVKQSAVPFRIPSPPPFSGRLLPPPRLRSLLPDASGPAQVSPEVSRLKEEVAELKKKLENSEKKKEKPGSSLKRLILSERTLQDQIDSQKAINAGLNVSIDALADILVRKEETIKELRKGTKEKKGEGKPAKKKFKFTIEVEVDDEKLEGTTVSVEK